MKSISDWHHQSWCHKVALLGEHVSIGIQCVVCLFLYLDTILSGAKEFCFPHAKHPTFRKNNSYWSKVIKVDLYHPLGVYFQNCVWWSCQLSNLAFFTRNRPLHSQYTCFHQMSKDLNSSSIWIKLSYIVWKES